MASSTMVRRRRTREETADERLDRLISLEMRTRSGREEPDQGRPELRRLRIEGGEPAASSGLAVEDRAPPEDPMGRLVPLFEELALGPQGPPVLIPRADQGVYHGGRPERAPHNVLEVREEVPIGMSSGADHAGQVQRWGDQHQDVLGRDLRSVDPRRLEYDLQGPPGAQHLLGPLHQQGVVRDMERPVEPGQTVVVPTVTVGGSPDIELLPAERDHGLDIGAAVAWTQRQLGNLVRPRGAVGDLQGLQREGPERVESADQELERIRQRCLQEAEHRYHQEVRRLRGEEAASYHTASSGGQGEPLVQGHPTRGDDGQAAAGATAVPCSSPELGRTGLRAPSPPPGLADGRNGHTVILNGPMETRQAPVGGMVSTPQGHGPTPGRSDVYARGGHQRGDVGGACPGLQTPPALGVGDRLQPSMYTEQVKGSELPPLPALGGDQAPLLFGDWLALVAPAMYDIAQPGKEWWSQVMEEVETLYSVWLQASPLQRLRLRPAEGTLAPPLQRIEMKGVNMLLQILPENIKRDVVASRTLSSTSIMFRLFTLFQPGGSTEKAGLLKQISEPKIAGNGHDLLQGIRTWRRWLARAHELNLVLPDSMVLAGVLAKFSDALAKCGNVQLGFRLSTARQELGIDHRPTRETVTEMAEYLQAEAEELALTLGVRPTAQPNAQTSATIPAVKAFSYNQGGADQGESDRPRNPKAPCKFWKSDDGCRKGVECTYLHDTAEMKGKCYGCGSIHHVKRECPVRKSQDPKTQDPSSKAVKKMQKTRAEKGEKSEKGTKPTSSTSSTATTEKGEGKTEVKVESQAGPRDPPEVTQGTPVSATDEILREAADLLKSLKLRSVKAIRLKSVAEGVYGAPGEFALLDGGATNALRKARAEEMDYLIPTTVELAHGTTTLYRVSGHQTLLSKTEVEPIIPLSWLVQGGYQIDWSRDRCVIHHPERGPLCCELRAGCPVMPRDQGLALLDDLEKGRLGSRPSIGDAVQHWWSQHFPELPQRLLQWTNGQDQAWKSLGILPWNRHRRRKLWKSRGVIVHLFAGQDHRPWEAWKQRGYEVLCLDVKKGGDLHNPAVWAFLWELASCNKVIGVIGGPPCRTVSRLRMRQPGPAPLRGRALEERWGLSGLALSDSRKVDYDTMLLLKQVALWKRAEECRVQRSPTIFLLESPEDPANYLDANLAENMPSFWQFPELQVLQRQPGFSLISFDQGTMGHVRCKPTSILCNLDDMRQLHGVRVNDRTRHPLPEAIGDTIKESEKWAKWAPGLVQAIIQAVGSALDLVTAQTAVCKRLDTEGFKKHIQNHHVPFRRDCRQCLETMGQSEPHRRTKLDGAAYCLSIDLAGPFPLGRDEGFNKRTKAKYLLVGTVAIPRWDRDGTAKDAELGDEEKLPKSSEDPAEEPEPIADLDQLQEEEEQKEIVSDEEVRKLNESWIEKAKELSTTVGLQHVTMVEVLETRHTRDVVPGVGRIYAKMKAHGIPIHRVHSDRERCFITDSFRDFCLNRSIYQTMTSGDTPQENGRVESEIYQIKRRLRLMLSESKLPKANWPNVARWVGEQRFRQQMSSLGISTKPMIAPGTKVMVKQKLWNKKMGALSNPYKRMTLLGPSPLMSSGWVVKDGHKVQHARVVVQESSNSEAARLELEETLPRRLIGKQPPVHESERLQPPKATDPEETDLEDFVPAQAVPEVEYDPESPIPDENAEDSQGIGPALHALQAGGECYSLEEEKLETVHRGEYLECQKCGLMQLDGNSCCGFCLAALRVGVEKSKIAAMSRTTPSSSGLAEGFADGSRTTSSSSGLADGARTTSSSSGLADGARTTSSSSGLADGSRTTSSSSGLADGSRTTPSSSGFADEGGTTGPEFRVQDPGELIDQLRREHWGWKQQWNEELARTVVGVEKAALHGGHLEYLEDVLVDLEEELELYDHSPGGERGLLKALTAEQVDSQTTAHPVLQTYTVGLAEVRSNMKDWEGAIRKELTSLFETTKALRRTTVGELTGMSGSDQMEQAPMKLVATVKAPDGRKKARLVLCGNMIQSATGAPVTTSRESLGSPLYAGGLDGVALRAVLRKAAACDWSIASTDVRTAFLLAPRQSSRLLVVRPPQLLVDYNLASRDERWVVDHAVYGLETSPKDWGGYRDTEMAKMTWTLDGYRYRFAMSTEPNLWKILQSSMTEDGEVDDESETSVGFVVTYVDDLLALGPREVVAGALKCVREKWDCSPEEWVTKSAWMKFCGMELRWKEGRLLVGQPSYARELVNRHGLQQPRSTPAPKVEPEILEENKTPDQVRQAQQVVGELLWLSVRTRPDLSYIVSWMGRHVAKAPQTVCQVADHVIGYLQETLDYTLSYGICPADGEGSLKEIVALSDASHAPGGGRGCQGIMVMWGGEVIQWEAKAQPFAALSSTEAELIGYVEAMTMGESLGAVVSAIEGDQMLVKGCYRLKGDNLSGLQLLVAPDGPWRTRHLRLRSYVLRERIATGDWIAEHVPGAQLVVDLLTKPIVVAASWMDFRRAVGLIEFKEEFNDAAKVEKLSGCLEGLLALSKVLASSGVSSVAKAASAVGLSTLVACIHQETQDLKRARCTGKAGDTIGPATASPGLEAPVRKGEVEKRKVLEKPPQNLSKGLRENEPTQAEHVMKALRMSGPLGRSASIAVAEAMEMEPPFDFWPLTEETYKRAPTSGKDQWVRLGRGWWCKQHKEWRITSFNPIHRNVPFPVESLVPERFTLCYWRDAQGRWLRQCHQDGWMQPPKRYLENEPTALSPQWIGYTFFKIDENMVNPGDVPQPQVVMSHQVDWREEARGSEMTPPDRIAGGARARGRAALPMTLRGSIRKSFPGGVLPSQQQQVLRHRPGQGEGSDQAEGHPPEVRGHEMGLPSSGAYHPTATPYYAGGHAEIPYRISQGESLRGERAESETATSDVVTELVVHEEPADEDPTNGDPYDYMLTHVVDTVEDMMWQSGASLPLPNDPMPIGDGLALGAAFQNGRHPRVATLRPLMGQAFQSGMRIPRSPTEEAFEDTMSDPGEAIARLLEPPGPAHVKGHGKGSRPRRVPAGHPEWAPPLGGGRDIEIHESVTPTESDEEDDGFQLVRG